LNKKRRKESMAGNLGDQRGSHRCFATLNVILSRVLADKSINNKVYYFSLCFLVSGVDV
jgi:hypothetical protein